MKDKEQRSFKAVELRVEGEQTPVIRGYAAIFNAISENLGWFREIIKPGAFKKTINDGADVRALFNHNPDYVIGRSKSGTLKLTEDEKGLFIEATPPDTTWARDLTTSIKRGDIDQMSFGFQTVKDQWDTKDGEQVRTLTEVKLFDVSPVTYPAYPQTSVSARSILGEHGIDFNALTGVLVRAKCGAAITQADREILNRSIEILKQVSFKTEPGNHSVGESANESQVRTIANLTRRLEIAERESLLRNLF